MANYNICPRCGHSANFCRFGKPCTWNGIDGKCSCPGHPVIITPRQTAVIRHLALGMTCKEVGVVLMMTENTVQTHVTRIQHRMRGGTLAGLVARALKMGIISLGDIPDPGIDVYMELE